MSTLKQHSAGQVKRSRRSFGVAAMLLLAIFFTHTLIGSVAAQVATPTAVTTPIATTAPGEALPTPTSQPQLNPAKQRRLLHLWTSARGSDQSAGTRPHPGADSGAYDALGHERDGPVTDGDGRRNVDFDGDDHRHASRRASHRGSRHSARRDSNTGSRSGNGSADGNTPG